MVSKISITLAMYYARKERIEQHIMQNKSQDYNRVKVQNFIAIMLLCPYSDSGVPAELLHSE